MSVEEKTKEAAGHCDLDELSAGVARGDAAAFESLHDRLDPGLRRFMMRRAAAAVAEAEELAHRSWVEVWKLVADGRYDHRRARFSTFLYGVAWKVILRHRRARGKSRELIGEDAEFLDRAIDSAEGPAETLGLIEMMEALKACINAKGSAHSLSEEERWLTLASGDGASEREMALEIAVAPSTLHARKEKAMGKIRSCLKEKGFDRFSWRSQ